MFFECFLNVFLWCLVLFSIFVDCCLVFTVLCFLNGFIVMSKVASEGMISPTTTDMLQAFSIF